MRNGSREEKSIMLDFYKNQISEKLEQIDNVDFLIKIYSIFICRQEDE